MLTTFQLRVMFSLEFCISWKHRCVAQCRTRASDVIFPTFIYSSIYWTPCKQISDAWFPSSFPPPLPSLISRPAPFLSWCVTVTLESKMWVLAKECVFCVWPIWGPLHPSSVTLSHSFPALFSENISPLSNCTIIASQSELDGGFFFSTSCPFSSDTSQSHTFAITQLKTLHFSALAACLSLLARLWEFFHSLCLLNFACNQPFTRLQSLFD